MNKITKRIVAGASALAMLVSAVGVEQFADLFMKTSYAEGYVGKTAQSTGFSNLEQDTTKGNAAYNTGYGLHTNKTVTNVGDDGRTFDVNLESWYVGENPVDVATILDASGSMAWTVDTLDPLEITDFGIFESYTKPRDISISNIEDLQDIQEANGGYLPQDVVDCILDPENTDNSKLGYDDYMYYVYEARSSVSEFVPLGYWDGGIDPKNDESLIGYYPFSGDLKNKAPNAKEGATGMLINHPTGSESTYDTSKPAAEEMKAEFSTQTVTEKVDGKTVTKTVVKGLNIADSSSKGAILVDSPKTNKFSISFELSVDDSKDGYDDAPILYLADGKNYYRLFRAGGSSASRLKMSSSKGSPLNANKAVNSEPRKWTFTFDFENKQLTIETETKDVLLDNNNKLQKLTVSLAENPKLDIENLKIYIGGDNTEHTNQNTIYIKNLSIKDINSDGTETEVANYPLDTKENDLKNTVNEKNPATFVAQAYNNDGKFGEVSLDYNLLDPVFDENNKYLNVKATSQNGAVSIDAVPELDEDGFTISMKLQRTNSLDNKNNNQQNIFYYGDKNKNNDYYQYFRSANAGGFLGITKGVQQDFTGTPSGTDMVYYKGGMANNDWYTNTLVFKPDPDSEDKVIITPYINGKPDYQDTTNINTSIASISVNKDDLVLLLCALKKNGSGSNQYLDDLYVFDKALDAEVVNAYFGDNTVSCDVDGATHALSYVKDAEGNFVKDDDGNLKTIEIAQISNGEKRLGQNTNINQRRGWYYVNSASAWSDIAGCLASGKQYIGIKKEDKGETYYSHEDKVTIPSGMDQKLIEDILDYENGSDSTKHDDYVAPSTERSIRFYVDSQSRLRCFVWSGADSKEDDPRTFCSLVYEKKFIDSTKSMQKTKYEELNSALNAFYGTLAENSDLSNTSVVRFSTINAVDQNETETTNENLKKLIMKDWSNWSDEYLKNAELKNDDYLKDLLIPSNDEEDATTAQNSSARGDEILEYPYVMTGGTYTWTGLKSFYDNMVDKEGLVSGDKVYDIANDARDKYLIIFTDGRDNTVGSTDKKYNEKYSPEGYPAANDAGLAEAWANKLKNEGYTIYCVMLATGSISEYANEDEFKSAKDFLLTLAGRDEYSKQSDSEKKDALQVKLDAMLDRGIKPDDSGVLALKDQIAEIEEALENDAADRVITVSPGDESGITVTGAFQQILNDIQKPRNDYAVQDYIDPRFNLVGKDSNNKQVIYHLGANGYVTATNEDGETVYVSTNAGWSNISATVGNFIDEGTDTVGIIYTPQDSYMVNRKETTDSKSEDGYDWGDGYGTGYLYYDDDKDMYYLRWEDQVIPMKDEAFDTEKASGDKKLDVWSATIRLKAKDDFIGGNNILTNGNEAGENLVYSDATIENMDKNPELYFTDSKTSHTLREKLQVLSGTDRKINAVDAGGVSQAVYGDGIDIPSSGFPRTTVNVRLLKLDAKNLNDVIYMGEVVSPTMMLADLENDYMTGSYYLEYLERYAYRLYGYQAAQTPLLDLLNQWLKIDDENEFEKTFTIPYIYLPEPIYKNDNTLETERAGGKNKVKVNNSTGMSTKEDGGYIIADFEDLNLRDVTGFITYTWKRDEGSVEEQQKVEGVDNKYDITKEYVVKDTNQIKYKLQLKFTPLKEDDLVDGEGKPLFTLEKEKFITEKDGTVGDKFFNVDTNEESSNYNEFVESDENKWVFTNRSDYLKAMVSETHTYTPHVMYDDAHGKWVLVDKESDFTPDRAVEDYSVKDLSKQTTVNSDGTITDTGVYDWNTDYKSVAGSEQLEEGQSYTNTPGNVVVSDDKLSLVANTTYIKDVVNAALALEIYVDGKYLQSNMPLATRDDKTFTFEATRYYNDPLDPLPYGGYIDADTGEVSSGKVGGKKYKLTFSYAIPADAKPSEVCRLWATLTKVEVEQTAGEGDYELITTADGYAVENALPIGTYEISVSDTDMESMAETSQYYLGIADRETAPGHFQYLKIENDVKSYTYDRFPDKVVSASADAVKDTGDKEYQIQNGTTDYSKANIAENNREKAADKQTVTFYFGTVAEKEVSEDTTLHNIKGVSVKEYLKEHPEDTKLSGFTDDYAKDRLGIIMLSASANSLAITKEVTRTNDSTESYKNQDWDFTVTVKTSDTEWITSHESSKSIDYTLYNLDGEAWKADTTKYKESFETSGPDDDGMYTLTVNIKVKHNQKVVLNSLPEGTWQVKEVEKTDVLYTPHNDQFIYGEDEWQYKNAAETRTDIELSPASQVNYVNEFPHELPSTGDSGIVRLIILGTMFTLCSVMLFAIPWYNCRKCRTMKK